MRRRRATSVPRAENLVTDNLETRGVACARQAWACGFRSEIADVLDFAGNRGGGTELKAGRNTHPSRLGKMFRQVRERVQ